MSTYKLLTVDKLMVGEIVPMLSGTSTVLSVGTFASTTVGEGKGTTLSSTRTSALRTYTDDGGVVVGATNLRAAAFRLLNTKDTLLECTQSGSCSQIKIYRASGAVDLGVNARYSGAWGYVEMAVSAASSATITGSVVAGVRATVEIDKAFTVATGAVVAGLQIEGKFTGAMTATGRCSAINIEAQSTGAFDTVLSFNSATLCGVEANTDATAANRTYRIKCNVAGTPFYLNGYAA